MANLIPEGEDHELTSDCRCRPGLASSKGEVMVLHFPDRL